jgi:hypothetical protein
MSDRQLRPCELLLRLVIEALISTIPDESGSAPPTTVYSARGREAEA